MKMMVDEDLWRQAFKETLFCGHKHVVAKTLEEAFSLPGRCVKSMEREKSGFPKYHGIIVKYGDECVVRGHNSIVSDCFVWTGTKEEYGHFWMVD